MMRKAGFLYWVLAAIKVFFKDGRQGLVHLPAAIDDARWRVITSKFGEFVEEFKNDKMEVCALCDASKRRAVEQAVEKALKEEYGENKISEKEISKSIQGAFTFP